MKNFYNYILLTLPISMLLFVSCDNDDDDLISGFPTTVLRKRPDFVLTGAPAPGRPKDKEASWK